MSCQGLGDFLYFCLFVLQCEGIREDFSKGGVFCF